MYIILYIYGSWSNFFIKVLIKHLNQSINWTLKLFMYIILLFYIYKIVMYRYFIMPIKYWEQFLFQYIFCVFFIPYLHFKKRDHIAIFYDNMLFWKKYLVLNDSIIYNNNYLFSKLSCKLPIFSCFY